jgi:hypothetical protein
MGAEVLVVVVLKTNFHIYLVTTDLISRFVSRANQDKNRDFHLMTGGHLII